MFIHTYRFYHVFAVVTATWTLPRNLITGFQIDTSEAIIIFLIFSLKSLYRHWLCCVCQPDLLHCTKYSTQVHGMLEMCMHWHQHFGPSLQHPVCKHQDLLSGPSRGVFSTDSPQKASAPDPICSGCPSFNLLVFLLLFSSPKEVLNRGGQEQVSSVRRRQSHVKNLR